ncbi:MAG: hypothetical protein P1V97_21460 [Planctomycetota bacterium]|nr:hypothetical protein [Planctomycetota bacterium]
MDKSSESKEVREGQGGSESSKWRNCFVLLALIILLFCVLPLGLISRDDDPVDESALPFLPAPKSQDFPEKKDIIALLTTMDKRHSELDSPDFMALKYGDADWTREGSVTRANEPALQKIRQAMNPLFKKDSGRAVAPGRPGTAQKSSWSLLGRHWNRHINLLQREGKEKQAFEDAISLLEFSKGLRGLYSYDECAGGMSLSRGALKKIIHLSRNARDGENMKKVLNRLNRFEVSSMEVKTWLSRDYRLGTLKIHDFANPQGSGDQTESQASKAAGFFGPWLYKNNQTHRILAKAYKNAYNFVDLAKSPYFLEPFKGCGFSEAELFEQSPDWWLGGNGLGYETFLVKLPEQLRETIMQRWHLNGLLRFAQVYLAIKVYQLREGVFPDKLEAIAKDLPDHFFTNQKPFEFAYEQGIKLEIQMIDAVYKDVGHGMLERKPEKIRISAASFKSAKRPPKKR